LKVSANSKPNYHVLWSLSEGFSTLAQVLLRAYGMSQNVVSDWNDEVDLDFWFHGWLSTATAMQGKRILRVSEELGHFIELGGFEPRGVEWVFAIFAAVSRCEGETLELWHFGV